MRNKVLIHSIAFSPDAVSTAYLYNDIVLRLIKADFKVVVLTTTPHYNIVQEEIAKQPLSPRSFGLYYESDFHGAKVLHIPQKKFKNTFLRLLGFIYWHILALFLGLNQKDLACILSPSPPLTIGIISIIIAKIKRCKSIYNVQEIYPDILVNHGTLRNKYIISFFKRIEKWVYNNSNFVTTIDKVFFDTIKDRVEKPEKLKIIPNFVDTKVFKPVSKEEIFLDKKLFPLTNNLKIMYAGNVGFAQDWSPFLRLVELTRDRPIEYYVIGEGVMKKALLNKVKGFENVRLLPYQNRNEMAQILCFADLHFIFMSPKMDNQGFPSKIYSIMACKKPLLIMTQMRSPLHYFFENKSCAKIITETDEEEKVKSALKFIEDTLNEQEILTRMGQAGFEIVRKNYTSEVVTDQYLRLIEQCIKS